MKVHEYQAKELLKKYSVPVPQGKVAKTPHEASNAAREIGTTPVVLKAQIHAGGRGKGGGIKMINDLLEVEAAASHLLGSRLVTAQTEEVGKPVEVLLVEERLNVAREIYLGIVIDRSLACPVVLVSAEGGMEIERVAAECPEKVFTEMVDP